MSAPSRQPIVVGLSLALPIIATITTALRFYARNIKRIRPATDDYLTLAALLFSYGLSASVLAAAYLGGLGNHLVLGPNHVPIDQKAYLSLSKASYAFMVTYIPVLGITKLSVLFFYKRIFISRPWNIFMWVLIGIVSAWTIAFFFVNVLVSIPVSALWHPEAGKSPKSLGADAVLWAPSISDILLDAIILAVPVPQIWRLNMTTVRKLQITAIFSLGWFVVGTGIARLYETVSPALTLATRFDETYIQAPSFYWLVVEANVGIISACLPTLNPIASLKLSSIVDSLRKAFSVRSRSSSETIVRIPSWSESQNLQNRRATEENDASSAAESLPMRIVSHSKIRDIGVKEVV
ncbi:hypothetical protein F4777DRAFT_576303 [Nemania sp. FL0916]|nr:hypothetical protein F4777DRAFT_576303 [Nemania sp. FL0916]